MAATMTDNSKEVLSAFNKQLQNGLNAIGMTAERYAKKDTPVDTGRLRASITFATQTKQGSAGVEAESEDYSMQATPEDTAVYIGSNVRYAIKIETMDMPHKTGKAHFLRDAAAQHGDEYKNLMKKALET